MSIGPNIEAWKRRFAACLLATLAALMLTGAREVSQEWRQHEAHLDLVQAQLAEWSRHLAETSVSDSGTGLADRHALFLVRTCSLPSPQP